MLTRRSLLLSSAAAQSFPPLPYAPMPVPYLDAPPEVIPIDQGRQLFVDDYLIEQSSLTRVFHSAQYHPASPVLSPDRPWESTPSGPAAMPFSDGVWFDPSDNLFKLWYMAGYWGPLAYATSRDGIHFDKPSLSIRPGTNIVLDIPRGSTTVWLDRNEPNPARRFKLFRQLGGEKPPRFALHYSPDGIAWGPVAALSGSAKDRSTLFYNPFRKRWVFSLKEDNRDQRMRLYHEAENLEDGFFFTRRITQPWVGADPLDLPRADLRVPAELYNLDAVAYESLLVGLFTIWKGQPTNRPKPNELYLGFSRDGFHWHRPHRLPFIGVSERPGDWNWGNVQSAGGGFLVVNDKLHFYTSARAGRPGANSKDDGVCSTGLSTLRRDGFCSLRAGSSDASLTTRVLRFSGSQLFVNANAAAGELRVEILHPDLSPALNCSLANCAPIRADSTQIHVQWKGVPELSRLHGAPVRFRFHLRDAQLYSFWVSPDSSGASRGFTAAGGPGLTGPLDLTGQLNPAR